jgi:hypothetical protein
MYGMLDERTYRLYIKDGKDERVIPIPAEGMTLLYLTNGKPPEEVYIPPRAKLAKAM